jgi:GNAT superfamily N-acetyltransferase
LTPNALLGNLAATSASHGGALNLVSPATEHEIAWIAEKYEKIGERSIPGYHSTDDRLEQAKEQVRGWIQNGQSKVLLVRKDAADGSVPLGMLICHVRSSPLDEFPECFIDAVYVEASARRQGIGRKLLAEATRWAKAHGARRTKTFVASNNREMLDLCRAAGYETSFVELQCDLD